MLLFRSEILGKRCDLSGDWAWTVGSASMAWGLP